MTTTMGLGLQVYSQGALNSEKLQIAASQSAGLAGGALFVGFLGRIARSNERKALASLLAMFDGLGAIAAVAGCACAWWHVHHPGQAAWAENVAHQLYASAAVAVTTLPVALLLLCVFLGDVLADDPTHAGPASPANAPTHASASQAHP